MEVVHGDLAGLHDLLHPDAVLHSPVLFRPQAGRDVVAMYLTAAAGAFAGVGPAAPDPAPDESTEHVTPDGTPWDGHFRYVGRVTDDRCAVLEFETTLGGSYVNGVDMITCDADGRITDFKVMVRPLRAVEAVREQMMATLERMNVGQTAP